MTQQRPRSEYYLTLRRELDELSSSRPPTSSSSTSMKPQLPALRHTVGAADQILDPAAATPRDYATPRTQALAPVLRAEARKQLLVMYKKKADDDALLLPKPAKGAAATRSVSQMLEQLRAATAELEREERGEEKETTWVLARRMSSKYASMKSMRASEAKQQQQQLEEDVHQSKLPSHASSSSSLPRIGSLREHHSNSSGSCVSSSHHQLPLPAVVSAQPSDTRSVAMSLPMLKLELTSELEREAEAERRRAGFEELRADAEATLAYLAGEWEESKQDDDTEQGLEDTCETSPTPAPHTPQRHLLHPNPRVNQTIALSRIRGLVQIRRARDEANVLRKRKERQKADKEAKDAAELVQAVWNRYQARKTAKQRRAEMEDMRTAKMRAAQTAYAGAQKELQELQSRLNDVLARSSVPMPVPEKLSALRERFEENRRKIEQRRREVAQRTQYVTFLQRTLVEYASDSTLSVRRWETRNKAVARIRRAWRRRNLVNDAEPTQAEYREQCRAMLEEECALAIQRAWMRWRRKRRVRTAAVEGVLWHEAAMMVQRAFHGAALKRRVRSRREALEATMLEEHCVVVQKTFRGYQTRRRLAQNTDEATATTAMAPPPTTDTPNDVYEHQDGDTEFD